MQASRWKEGEPALFDPLVFKSHQQLICYSLKKKNTGKKSNLGYETKRKALLPVFRNNYSPDFNLLKKHD